MYRLYALAGTGPRKPGLMRVAWPRFRRRSRSAPLLLEDGTAVKGFLCEAHAAAGADDISRYRGWRAYLAGREGRDG